MDSKAKKYLGIGAAVAVAGIGVWYWKKKVANPTISNALSVPTVSTVSELSNLATSAKLNCKDITTLRETPSQSGKITAYIPKGATVDVLAANAADGFVPVKYSNYKGFVLSSMLTSDKVEVGVTSTASNAVVNAGNKVNDLVTKVKSWLS